MHINGILVPFIYKPVSRYAPVAFGQLAARGPQVQITSALIRAFQAGWQLTVSRPLVSTRKYYGLRPKYLPAWYGKLSALAPNHPLYTRRATESVACVAPTVRTNVTRVDARVAAAEVASRIPVVTSGPKKIFAYGNLPYRRLAGKKIVVSTFYLYKPTFAVGQRILVLPLASSGTIAPPSIHGGASVLTLPGFAHTFATPPTLLVQVILNVASGKVTYEFITPQRIQTLTALLYKLTLNNTVDWVLEAMAAMTDIEYELSLVGVIERMETLMDVIAHALPLNPEVVINLVQRN